MSVGGGGGGGGLEDVHMLDADGMLAVAGDFGRYQLMLMLLFSLINVLSAFHYFGQTFISVIPDQFSCNATGIANVKQVSECTIAVEDADADGRLRHLACPRGWIYNTTNMYGFQGIVQELNWVCSDNWKSVMGQSVFFVGSVVGSIVFGILADTVGRLHVLVASNMFAFFGNMITAFSSNAIIYAFSRLLAGCATDSNFVMMYIIVMEYIRPSLRTMGLNICIGIFYCFSCIAVPWVAVLLGNWRLFLIVFSVPHLLVLSFYFLVPESAQWLISKGKTEDALRCYRRIAKINGKQIPDKSVEALKRYCREHVSEKPKYESIWGLVRTPKLRRKTFILIFKSMVMTLCYDAISRNVNGLGYSAFVVFSVTSATILPACLFILTVQDRAGRKALASGALLLSGVFSFCSGVVLAVESPSPRPFTILTLAVVARLGINVAYNSGHQYAVELIPTVVRGQGVSAIHVAGYAASFFSPQILYLSAVWRPMPEVILGGLLALGALACLFLPETLNKSLPVTLQDGEEFGEDERIFEFACCKAPTESTTVLHINTNTYSSATSGS